MKHKLVFLIASAFCVASDIAAQQASNLVLFEQNEDQVSVLKSTLALHNIEENIFWPLYEQYEKKLSTMKSQTFESLQQLTMNTETQNASDKVQVLFSNEKDEASLRKEYFEKLKTSTNAAFALHFLQSESLFDLLLKSRLYEKLAWEKPVWNSVFLKDEAAKISVLEFTLGIPKEERERFKSLAGDFEFEYSRIVGHQFVFFEQCLDNVSELTPRQCQSLGEMFTSMQEKEVVVKERFFQQLNDAYDSDLAARFIALEEYFTIMAKLKIWSDYVGN